MAILYCRKILRKTKQLRYIKLYNKIRRCRSFCEEATKPTPIGFASVASDQRERCRHETRVNKAFCRKNRRFFDNLKAKVVVSMHHDFCLFAIFVSFKFFAKRHTVFAFFVSVCVIGKLQLAISLFSH